MKKINERAVKMNRWAVCLAPTTRQYSGAFQATVSRRYIHSINGFIICIFFTYREGYEIMKDATYSRHGEMTTVCEVPTPNLMGTERIGVTECKVVPVLNQATRRENV
jgi:hypothetical protein